jgi:hypothetical protein
MTAEIATKKSAKINWNDVVEKSVPIFKEFAARGVVPTLRTIYYALVSKEIIPNTKSAYKGLSSAFVDARKDGIVNWAWLADEARDIEKADDFGWSGYSGEDVANIRVKSTIDALRRALGGELNYDLERWTDQNFYVEVWIEKAALRATFQDWLGKYKVALVPSRGYSSWTFLKAAADRIASDSNGREVKIVYFGDFDPSGVDIERFIRESLRGFFAIDVEVRRFGVTKEQIAEYNLPTTPDDAEEIAKLQKDSRFAKWEDGLYRVELDALLAFVPDEFKKIVLGSVEEFFDEDVYSEVQEREAVEEKAMREKIKNELPAKVNELLRELGLKED